MADPVSQLAIFSAATSVLLGGEAATLTLTGLLAGYGISISTIGTTGVGTATVGTTLGTVGTVGTTVGTVGTATAVGTATTVGTASTTAIGTATTAAGIALGPVLGIAVAVLGAGAGMTYLYKRSKKTKQELIKICELIGVATELIKRYKKELVLYLLEKEDVLNKLNTEKRVLQSHEFKDEILEGNRVFMVIGESGAGKSTFCNRLLGDKSEEGDEGFYVSHGGRGTSKLSKKSFQNNTGSFTIVDTPGCNDEEGEEKDDEYMNNIIGYLNGCGGVNAFLLVVSLAEARVKGSLINLWKQYQERFGKEFWKYSILVLTNLDSVNKRKLVCRKENCLEQLKNNFGVTDQKIIMIGHYNYKEAIKELLTKYSRNKFVKDNLKSPLHDLLEKKKELNNKMSQLEEVVAGFTTQLVRLQKRKKELS